MTAGEVPAGSRRLFFAVVVPSSVRTALTGLQQHLRERGIRAGAWTRPELFHITVHFLGATPERLLPDLEAAVKRTAARAGPFALTSTQVGVFAKGRILWAGLADDDGLVQLRMLYADLGASLSGIDGVTVESRPYTPHLTLARKLDLRSWQGGLDAEEGRIKAAAQVDFPVEAVSLLESTRKDGQLVYPVISQSPFSLF